MRFCLLVSLALSLLVPKISSSKSHPITGSSLRSSLLPTGVDSSLSSPPSTPTSVIGFACTPDSSCFLCWATSSASCLLACARVVTTHASSFCPRTFSKTPPPSSSPSSATSVPSRTETGKVLDTAASTWICRPSISIFTSARGYNTVSPCAQRIVTASPSCIFWLGTKSSRTRVLEHPVSSTTSRTYRPSTTPCRRTPCSCK